MSVASSSVVTDLLSLSSGVSRAVAIGNFDGVHRGHAALVRATVAAARSASLEACVLTFTPHPARLLAPDRAPPLLMPEARKIELLLALGVDRVLVQPFDWALAALSPHAFAHDLLRGVIDARVVSVGYDFSFGAKRAGTVTTLGDLGRELGFVAHVVPAVRVRGVVCASSAIRALIAAGRVDEAEALLGRPAELEGKIVHGARRGHTIGFPTINVAYENEVAPAGGVYVGEAQLADGSVRRAAINIGTNPTFTQNGAPVRVEAHLLDYGGDLYGQHVRLAFWQRLRDEKKFDGVDALVTQIRADVEEAASHVRADLPPTD